MTLSSKLAPVLPAGSIFNVSHIQSTPKQMKKPLLIPHKKAAKPVTVRVDHFLTLAKENVVAISLEIYVYISIFRSHIEYHLFVSKADTTGLAKKIRVNSVLEVMIDYLVRIPIASYLQKVVPARNTRSISPQYTGSSTYSALVYLANQLKTQGNLTPLKNHVSFSKYLDLPVKYKFSLFTRPSNQYLFPYSYKNEKHILSGEALLKWWIKIFNRLSFTGRFKLVIPGSERATMSKYLPDGKWSIGNIFSDDEDVTALYHIPCFPDDPKTRFLENLIVENRHKSTNVKNFWLELSYRQEFISGIVVAVLGVEFEMEEKEEDFTEINKLNKKDFRNYRNLVTGEDYSDLDNVIDLFDTLGGLIDWIEIVGTEDKKENINMKKEDGNFKTVGDINMLVRKKEKPVAINDLSSLVKRKKEIETNDLTGLIRKNSKNV